MVISVYLCDRTDLQGRARHSIRRRPPSRRHRNSSSGEDVGEGGEVPHSAKDEEGGGEDQGDGQTEEVKEDEREASTGPAESKAHQEENAELKHSTREEEEEERDGSSKEEEKKNMVKEDATNANGEDVDRTKTEVIHTQHIPPCLCQHRQLLRHLRSSCRRRRLRARSDETGGVGLSVEVQPC